MVAPENGPAKKIHRLCQCCRRSLVSAGLVEQQLGASQGVAKPKMCNHPFLYSIFD